MIVLDASMAIAWLLDDEDSGAAEHVLRRTVDDGAVVPSHWRLEVANVLTSAVRRGRCDDAHVDRSLLRLSDLKIEIDSDTNTRAWGATLSLARTERLTTYDAAYLELALRGGHALASLDRDLVRAARRLQVAVVGE